MQLLAYDTLILLLWAKQVFPTNTPSVATDEFTICVFKNAMTKVLKKVILMPNSCTLEKFQCKNVLTL